ncbi:mitochondrial carrier domain-containing protein [Powellomyces hirtus]|nr:mitochondrial carrier domain-containing protein [Powellomyces hirtus]
MPTQSHVSPQMHLLGGGVSGLASCVVLQPLDLVKTRLQQETHTLFKSVAGGGQGLRRVTLWSVASGVVATDSVSGLWRGTWPTILRNVPGSALYFACLEQTRRALRAVNIVGAPVTITPGTINLISGATSRVMVGMLMMPITVIKVRYESNMYRYTSVLAATRGIVREHGIRGLFAGSGATILRDAPHAGLYVFFYEHSKDILKAAFPRSLNSSSNNNTLIHTTSACVSGVAATVVTNPFDVVKTRMQLNPRENPSMPRTAWKIITEERASGFFAGMLPRLLRKTVSAAITWTIYEEVVRWAGDRI